MSAPLRKGDEVALYNAADVLVIGIVVEPLWRADDGSGRIGVLVSVDGVETWHAREDLVLATQRPAVN